jgi:hypothetical protein
MHAIASVCLCVQRIAQRERVPVNGETSHLNFTCRCSFLQIYAEKISDLLHDLPSGRDQALALLSTAGPGQTVQVKDLTEHLVLNGMSSHSSIPLS